MRLTTADHAAIADRVAEAERTFRQDHPGEAVDRQPVHTVYGGAHLFKADTGPRLGALARRALDLHAPEPATFAAALGIAPELAEVVHARVVAKLAREPVEDFRIDFEDGFGVRPPDEEDATADRAAAELARGLHEGLLPPFVGIRVKAMSTESHARAVRTLDRFLGALVEGTGGALPPGFVVTLPKVATTGHVAALCDALERLEAAYGLPRIPIELMVELTAAVIDRDGRCPLPGFARAAGGRLRGAHFGTYDYTASAGITARHQAMTHPAADFAKHLMQAAFAGTGIHLSDGATTVLPLGDTASVHAAWRRAYADIRHSLAGGFYQGWDLHPAQIPVRYAAVHAFFLEDLPGATARLRAFLEAAARARVSGAVFDDAATGQGLLNQLLRAHASGALTEGELLATGLTLDALRTRSFSAMLGGRPS